MHEKQELLWPYELRLARRRPAGNQRLQAACDEGLGDPDPEQRGEPEVGRCDQRSGPGGNRVVRAALRRGASLPSPPALQSSED